MLFALTGVVGHGSQRLAQARHPRAGVALAVSRRELAGKPVTNRGLTRPGTKALTPTGYAHRRWLPAPLAARRMAYPVDARDAADLPPGCCSSSAAPPSTWASPRWPGPVTGRGGPGSCAQDYQHRKNYVKPLHARLAAAAGIPLANKPESWLEIPRDLSYVALTWPKGAQLPKPQERQAIEATAASTLGMRGAKPSWQFTGPRLKLRLVPPVPPPLWVYLDNIEWGYAQRP